MLSDSIKVIGFDLGYTLVYNQVREDRYIAFLNDKGIARTKLEVEQAFHLADKKFMSDFPGVLGKEDRYFFIWYLGLVNYYLNLSFDLIEQNQLLQQQPLNKPLWAPFPWTKEVLRSLKDAGYQLILLSNWDHSARGLLDTLGLTTYFDHLIISSEHRIEKPDERIFRKLLTLVTCEPNEVLYIGDNYYDDVVGSRKAGIQSVLLNRFGRLGIEEINDCNVIQNTKELLTELLNSRSQLSHAITGI